MSTDSGYMTGYTKLFGSIIASTIWRESKETKVVWITMLAMANKNGMVEASLPGLADMARVSVEETAKAVEILAAPDTFSRTKDFEGRRIQAVDGGWHLLNHAKYRAKMGIDERREYNRLKQQEWRAKAVKKPSQRRVKQCQTESMTVNDSEHCQHIAEADTEAKAVPDLAASNSQHAQVPEIRPRPRNLLMDALAAVDGSDPLQVTAGAWSGIGKALAEIKSVAPDVTSDEIARRAANYRMLNPDWALTPQALAKHWGSLAQGSRATRGNHKPRISDERIQELLLRPNES